MPKHHKKDKQPANEEEAEDIMAWGNRRDNYYQQGEEEYSQSEEEEAEAQKLYERQLEELAEQDLYELPQQDEQALEQESEEAEDNEDTQSALSHEYLTKQMVKMAKLGLKINEEPDSKIRKILQTEIQAYIMALIGLRQLKIPYIQHHPLFNKTIEMKQNISKLKKLLDASTAQEHTGQDEHQEDDASMDEEKELSDEERESEQEAPQRKVPKKQTGRALEKGLEIYSQTKKQQEEEKAVVKALKRKERQANKKPAFIEIKEDEGRLASEKILKNKGLIKKRKKVDRNGRVKLRRKFDKAVSKRRAYGHLIRQNPGRQYEGQRNIKYGKIASIKIK